MKRNNNIPRVVASPAADAAKTSKKLLNYQK